MLRLASKDAAREHLSQVQILFDEADKDGSGTLDRKEITTVISKFHEKAHPAVD